MSRQKFEKTFNTFTKGLMTEASELNFPEDFSLYEKNFLLHRDGGRDRRKGMELVYPLGLTLTSGPYPLEFDDGIAPGLVEPEVSWLTPPTDSVGIGLVAPVIYRRALVRYLSYENWEPESLGIGLVAPTINRKTEVRYLVHEMEPEQLSIGLLPVIVSRRNHPKYTIPEESISVGLLAPAIKRINV